MPPPAIKAVLEKSKLSGESTECSRWERGERRVSGALEWDPLARGVNPDRKSEPSM
jgi:hypothetical protein